MAGDRIGAEHRQELTEAWVVGRLGDGKVEGEIRVRGRLACTGEGRDLFGALADALLLGR